jgi:hypothetical protein
MFSNPSAIPWMFFSAITVLISYWLWHSLRELKRAEFIREFQWPAGLLSRIEVTYPHVTRKDSALVGNGLRQFFLAYNMSGRKYVAMPSQAADELWHEFILYTKDYSQFCDRAFGSFLHHTPAVVLSSHHKSNNEGLRRVWWQCCKLENIDAINPTRLPLLFALDTKLKIPNGYVYTPDCSELRRNGDSGGHCGGDFSNSSIDGGTDGLGSGAGDGSDGGDGGGCGGGGD